jgi:hypothetical protein
MFKKTANHAMCGADIEANRGAVCFLNDTPFLSTHVNVASFTTLKVRPSPNPLSQSWQLHIINAELGHVEQLRWDSFASFSKVVLSLSTFARTRTAWQIYVRDSLIWISWISNKTVLSLSLFYVWLSVHRKLILYKEPTWCNLAVCLLLTAIILYMFRTLFASILRST